MNRKKCCQLRIALISFFFFLCLQGSTQTFSEKSLFDSEEIIQIILSGDIRSALNDRATKPKKHPVSLSFSKEGNKPVTIPVQLQTRGNFRRMKSNCHYPPLWIHSPKTGESI
jgi:hypothetical protein